MMLQTVTGLVPVESVKLADGHAHLWISPPAGIALDAQFRLDNYDPIRDELKDFRAAGGTTVVDCQPGECGRDANRLIRLARETGLQVTATTGFHQQKYYPAGHWLWSATAEAAAAYFVEELTVGLRETSGIARATTIKAAYEGGFEGQSRVLMEAAAEAARRTGVTVLFHTERGKNVEALLPFFTDRGVAADRLYFCHVDKRPDVGLHRELARAGVLLGYDTFVRPQYDPDRGVWPLVRTLVDDGLSDHMAIGLDLAAASMWQHIGGGPGLLSLPGQIVPRLRAASFSEDTIAQLVGQNVARYLARRENDFEHKSGAYDD